MKNIITKRTYVLAILFVVGCNEQEIQQQANKDNYAYIAEKISYYKNPRTDVCYAATSMGGYNGLLTQVDCTEKVEKLLVK